MSTAETILPLEHHALACHVGRDCRRSLGPEPLLRECRKMDPHVLELQLSFPHITLQT